MSSKLWKKLRRLERNEDIIIRNQERFALNNAIRYSRHSSRDLRVEGKFDEGTPLESVCEDAAEKVVKAMMDLYQDKGAIEFQFHVAFAFSKLVGNWMSIKWPGMIDIRRYDLSKFADSDSEEDGAILRRFDWKGIKRAVRKLLLYKALQEQINYTIDAGTITDYVIGVHAMRTKDAVGYCDSRKHTRYHTYVSPGGGALTAKIMSPQSKHNNCGIQCLLVFYRKFCKKDPDLCDPPIPNLRAAGIRKMMTWIDDKMGLARREINWLAQYLHFRITVWDHTFAVLYTTDFECKRDVGLMLLDEHYWLVLESPNVSIQKRKFKKCNACGAGCITVRHKCPQQIRKRRKVVEIEKDVNDDKNIHAFYESVRKLDRHWLVHGPAGTGKSFIIRQLFNKLNNWGHGKGTVVLSTTGVSAIEVHGETINSYFNLGRMTKTPQQIMDSILKNDFKYRQIRNLRVVIIDEISMLNVSVFYLIDRMLRVIKRCNKPFGGVWLIMLGDVLQLPPVVSDRKKFRYIFEMELWQEIQHVGLDVVSLKRGWRYPRNSWFSMLKRLRDNSYNLDDIELLRTRIHKGETWLPKVQKKKLFPTLIYGRKNKVSEHNNKKLSELSSEKKHYAHLTKKGEIMTAPHLHYFESECGQSGLFVKKGAQVMCTVNAYKNKYEIGNGSRGIVLECGKTDIKVLFENGKEVSITYYNAEGGKFMPLILAWAITAHKSQGKTIECIVTEITKKQMFSASQAYVVLSRCIRLENVFITKFDVDALFINPRAFSFNKWCEEWPAKRFWSRTDSTNFLANDLFNESTRIRDTTHSALTIQPKDKYENMLYRNIIFYDFETLDDSRRKKEIPYFNHMLYYRDGVLKKEITICKLCNPAVDVQLTTFRTIMEIVIASCERYNREKLAQGFSREQPLYICAYNGSGFDFHFIMQELIKDEECSERFHTMTTMKGTNVVCMSMWDRHGQRVGMYCHDMLNITCSTLKEAAKSFLDGEIDKEVFPHLWVTPETLKYATKNKYVKLVPEDFPVSMRGELAMEDLEQFPFHNRLHQYGPNDVFILEKLYAKMEEISQEILETSVLRFNTLSKMTWYGFLMNLNAQFLLTNKKGYRKRRTQIYRMTREEDVLCSKAIYGAKVYPRIMEYKSDDCDKPYSQIKDYYVLLDIVSMYVKCMRDFDYPYGIHELFEKESDEIKTLNNRLLNHHETWDPRLKHNKFFICEADLECHEHEVEPPLGMKTPISGHGFKTSYTLHWENTRRVGWYTSIDIYLCLRNNGKVHSINRAFIWPKRGSLFRKWISKTFNGKKQAKKDGEKAKEKFYKTVGNGCYGSSLQRMFDDVIVHVKTYDELAHFHEGYEWLTTVNFEEVARNEHRMLIMKGRAYVNEKFEWTDRPRYLGAMVLAWSRMLYDDIYNVINPWRREGSIRSIKSQILYGDTDSFFVHCSALERVKKLMGEKCGMLGDDLNDSWATSGHAKIVKFNGPGPKSYALKAVMPEEFREEIISKGSCKEGGEYIYKGKAYTLSLTQTLREVVKIKGISRSGYTYVFKGNLFSSLTYDMIDAILNSDEKVTVVMEGRLMRNGVNLTKKDKFMNTSVYNICRKDLKRTLFKTKFTRRQVETFHPFTVPHGYDLKRVVDLAKEF